MGKSRGDFNRRNPVTRAMIEQHRDARHMDKRKRVIERLTIEELDNVDPDEYYDGVDWAGNVTINRRNEDE